MIRLLRGAAHIGFAVLLAGYPAAPAHALTPPRVDTSRLPPPTPPAPPRPSVQRMACTVAADIATVDPAANPLASLHLESVWPTTRGDGQRVAVIDTGVARHPRLPRLQPAGDYVADGDGTQDCDAHGTIVAGIIAATPDPADPTGFSGVAPAAALLTIRQSSTVFGPAEDPDAGGMGDVETMAAAVRTAADLGATVINISSVACSAGSLDDAALGAALAYAVDTRDAVVVTAAGNTGGLSGCPAQAMAPHLNWDSATVAVSPAWYDDYVLAVGSVAPDGTPSSFSLAGPWVDVAAPGERMVSLNPGGAGLTDALPGFSGAMPISGTSYAAPVVSGLAALIRSRFPELTARQVMTRIETTARKPAGGPNPVLGNGMIDALAALGLPPVADGAPPPNPEPPATAAPPPDVGQTPVRPEPTDGPRPQTVAMIGVLGCAGVLAVALTVLNATARLRQAEGRQNPADGHRPEGEYQADRQ